jgi:carboxyl-terminal processing protease
MKKLMLDIRGNPGGVLDQAVDISDIFLGKGAKVVYTRGRNSSSAQDFFAPGEGPHFDKPLVVLVNRGSASASEIVAGAIQDHDRGLVVGQRTWGKGLVQSVYTLPYGAGLALTTARYYTPSGRWIQRDYSDLLAYVNPEDPDAAGSEKSSDDTAKKTGQPFYTDAGRIVYAAGGITPDFLVKNNFDSKLVTQLLARNMFFNFAVQWLPKHAEIARDLQVTPALRQEFFRFVEASKFSTAEELERQWNGDPNKNLLDYALRIDIANVRFGLEAGWKVRASGDTQVQKGLTLFDEAARVAALPKKASPSHAARTL